MPTLTLSLAPQTREAAAAVTAPRKNLRVLGSVTLETPFAVIISGSGLAIFPAASRRTRGSAPPSWEQTPSSQKRAGTRRARRGEKVELALDWDGAQIAAGDDAIDHAVEDGLIGLHDVVAVHILGNAVDGLAGGAGQHGVEDFAHAQDFAGVDIDIGGLSGQALHGRLVNHDARIGQAEALALGALGKQDGRHGGRLTDADGDDIGP